jgi:hypothetical protein
MSVTEVPGTVPLDTLADKINAYVKHAVAVAISTAIGLGVLDPATGAIHVSSLHALYLVLLTTGLSLLMSYAGLGAPSSPKTVYVVPAATPSPVIAPAAIVDPPTFASGLSVARSLGANLPATPATSPTDAPTGY